MTVADFDFNAQRTLFELFAEAECRTEPLYERICRLAAQSEELMYLLKPAPPLQRRPNLLLAAIHDLVLAGTPHRLREYFPSVGGAREVDDEVAAILHDFCAQYRHELDRRIASRTTQTNEVGRCAVLLPVLIEIARASGKPLALLDVGCSAGLNLNFDRYAYRYGECRIGDPSSTILIESDLVGANPPPCAERMPPVHSRNGIDIEPVAVADADPIRWLRACIWPHDAARASRFDRAVSLMQRYPVSLQRCDDPVDAVQAWAAVLRPDVTPVVFNTWVLTYFRKELRKRYAAALHALVGAKGVYWLSAESPQVAIGDAVAPATLADAGVEWRNGTLWTLCRKEGERVRYHVVVRSHPHGKWMEWFGL